MQFKKITQLAKGWSSYIWLVRGEDGKEYALKEVREKSPRKNLAEREGEMGLLANKVGVGPRVVEVNYEKNFVVREFVNGKNFLNWISSEEFDKSVTPQELYEFIKELYRALLALDSISLSHNQLEGGKNILVEEKVDALSKKRKFVPVIIDFEKASVKENNHTRNIGQIESMFFYNPHGMIAKKIRAKLSLTL
ncbi:Uncharacterised protein [uncultured archaeon]|nr:Uncharacterised protein [uncultured archaeon]